MGALAIQASEAVIPERRARALLVEDDSDIAEFLVDNLTADRFDVRKAADGAGALICLREQPPDVVILDDGLPDMRGLDVLRVIRNGRADDTWDAGVPVIMLSGRADADSVVRGIQRGADDYVTKPFAYPELLARIGANLRRANGVTLTGAIQVGRLALDRRALTAHVGDVSLNLSAKEYALLVALARDPARAIPKVDLLREVWGYSHHSRATRTLDTHASRLRRKLHEAGLEGWVRNIWGYGYRLLPQER